MRQADYATEVRIATRQLWDALNDLKALQREWTALDYMNTLSEDAFQGENAGLDAAAIAAIVFTTTDALLALLATGHDTNLARAL